MGRSPPALEQTLEYATYLRLSVRDYSLPNSLLVVVTVDPLVLAFGHLQDEPA